jgi:C4-dicarboxylate transporter
VWLSLLLFIGCFVVLGVYSLREKNKLDLMSSTDLAANSSTYYNQTNLLIAAIICFVVAGLAFFVVLFNISTIALCIAIIKSSALFISSTVWIILIPIFFSALTIGYLIFWFIELAYLWSIGTLTKGTDTPFATVNWNG